MILNQNRRIQDSLQRVTKTDYLDILPLGTTLSPVIVVNDTLYTSNQIRIIKSLQNQSSSGTIFTTSTVRDTFIESVQIGGSSSTLNSDDIDVGATLETGEAVKLGICHVGTNATGASEGTCGTSTIVFASPIKLKRGTTVTLNSGVELFSAVVIGFEMEKETRV